MEKSSEKSSLEPVVSSVPYQQMGPSRLKHSVIGIISIVVTCLLFGLTLYFNAMMGSKDGPFIHDIKNLSDHYYFELTPADWAFAIWGLIYLMQLGFVIYAVAFIFRTTSKGPLYVYPPVVPTSVFAIYSFNLASTIAWFFVIDRMYLLASSVILLLNPLTLIACLVICLSKLKEIVAFFKSEGQKYELVLLHIFVYNALAIYLGWTICAALLNIGSSLIYAGGVGQDCTAFIVLTILSILILVVFPLELTILDKYLRYVIMHWLGPIVAMFGSVVKGGANDRGFKPSIVNRLYAAVILGALLICFMVKIVNIAVKSRRKSKQNRLSSIA